MHRVDRTTGGIGGDCGEKRGIEYTKADFLPFHVATGNAKALVDWITIRLRPPAQQHSANEEDQHRSPDGPAVFLILHHPAEVVSQSAADRKDGQHLDKIRERRWILERMRCVSIHVTAAVGTKHLDRHL